MDRTYKGNILIVDDNLANSRMVEDTLLKTDYQIVTAQNESIVFTKIQTIQFDLILIDLQFQNGDGIEICKRLKFSAENEKTPVILLTPSNDKATISKIFESKASDYIVRPFSRNELISRISPYLELSQISKINNQKDSSEKVFLTNQNEFLIRMSHSIRTQLNSIINSIELIKDSTLNDNQKECINIISSSTDNLFDLIKDVMDFSRIETGTIILEASSFDLHKSIEEIINSYDNQAKNKNLELSVEFENSTPVNVYGDPKRFSQVLGSLISNAVKYTSKGGVTVLVKPPKFINERKAKIMVEVIDTGIGISKEGIKQLFQTFSKVETKQQQDSGNGLGLIISKKLVELMGGEIGVRSQLGEGSTFWFNVEFEVLKGVVQQPEVNQNKYVTNEVKPLRVLLVEDNPINNRVAVFALQKLGHVVDSVLNGIDALSKFKPGSYDVIMMDISMPIIDGFETTRRIREVEKNSDQSTKPVKIIAMTANAIRGDREKCFESGMDEYMSKPFRLEDLIRILQ